MVRSRNPADPARVVWEAATSAAAVDEAVSAARAAFPKWSAWSMERRVAVLRRFAQVCKARAEEIAGVICDETGKVMWESRAEAGLLAGKVDITLEDAAKPEAGLRRVAGYQLKLSDSRAGKCWFRPHGVMAVLGPFNFPAHLPNGHIVPALAMGNTVVLKPSDKAPAVGQLLAEFFHEALDAEVAPPGVVNLVQGAAAVAGKLAAHDDIDGVLFTGSWPVGRRIMEANLDRPGRILALEMGGNNAAVVMPDADPRQAAIEIVRCAFNTTGQRCTCTRRAIIHRDVAEKLIPAICKAATQLVIGEPRATHPVFMGPIISEGARRAVLEAQTAFAKAGGQVLVESTEVQVGDRGGFYLTPSVVRVDRFTLTTGEQRAARDGVKAGGSCMIDDAGCDVEVFGPLLRISVADSFDDAIEQANATRFGLAASIFTKDQAAADRFLREARAGCVNVNAGTAGASSKLPFGGLGHSGNHRPAGSFSLDYCAYPVAGMLESGPAATVAEGMRFDDQWLR
ncbi:MAG: aldehyde dehydrogenase family protein [Phycisphaerales bacterium]|nr:aldehyde dehydrogenase family protein [Phycisphaerales bacterium]